MSPRKILFGEGLKALIRQDDRFTVVGLARNGKQAVTETSRKRPNLVLIDEVILQNESIKLIRRLRKQHPRMRSVIFGKNTLPEWIEAAMKAGASGFLRTDAGRERLLECMDVVTAGGFFVDGNSQRSQEETRAERVSHAGSGLTARETEILVAMAEGKDPKTIARDLRVSVKTVNNHRSHFMSKLGLDTAISLVRYAARARLIDLEEERKWRSSPEQNEASHLLSFPSAATRSSCHFAPFMTIFYLRIKKRMQKCLNI